MAIGDLGTLEYGNVREAWDNEAQDFTPWLAENLDILTKELDIGTLETEGKEVRIGRYRADILARIPQDGTRVIIENQLEYADLQHLGQLLAYMAGLEAQVVIWIATGFDDAHLASIRWLNEHTADPFAFFAIQVSVVRIGDSKLAPVFDVVERPNDWVRQVQDDGQWSELGEFRHDFWAHYTARYPESGLNPGYRGSFVRYMVEKAELTIFQYLAQDGVGIYASGKWGENRENYLPRLQPHIAMLAKELLAEELMESDWDWEHGFNGSLKLSANSRDKNEWDRMTDWLYDAKQVYMKVLADGTEQ